MIVAPNEAVRGRTLRAIQSGIAAVIALSLPATGRAEAIDLSIAPFVWAPTLQGELSKGPIVIPLNANPGDLAGGVKAGGMLHAEASGPKFQASFQAMYVDFHDRSFAPVFEADVRSSLLTAEMLAGPRIRRGTIEVVPMAGLRYTRITGALDAPGLGTVKIAKRWSEGLAGIEVRARLSPRLTLRARGTVAFAGPAGQSSADLNVAGTRQLTRGISLALGYRWARETVGADTASSFGMQLKAAGPVAGLVIGL